MGGGVSKITNFILWCWRNGEAGRIILRGLEYKLFENYHIQIKIYNIKVIYKQIVGNPNMLLEHPCVYVILRPPVFSGRSGFSTESRSDFPLLLLPIDTGMFLGAFAKLEKTIFSFITSVSPIFIQFSLTTDTTDEYFTWIHMYSYYNISLNSSYNEKHFVKLCRENKKFSEKFAV